MTAQFATVCTAHPKIQVLCDLDEYGACPECRAEIAEQTLVRYLRLERSMRSRSPDNYYRGMTKDFADELKSARKNESRLIL